MTRQLHNVNFEIIRYANCWEDADILLRGLDARPGGRHLSIGSGGDNSFSLLTTNPEFVVAVDLSRVQLFLIELKKAAMQKLDHQEFLSFLGFRSGHDRLKIYRLLREMLSPDTRAYWDHHSSMIETGLIYGGKFEKYFLLFSRKVLPLIHRAASTRELLREKGATEQQWFYQKRWNTLRWRLLFKIFFSKAVMGNVGRDPEFLAQVDIPVSRYIFEQAGHHLESTSAQHNYFLHFILTGEFGEELPNYVRKENYAKIQQNLDRLKIKEGPAEDALRRYAGINYLNLSNIFEYMPAEVFARVGSDLLEQSAPDAKFAYWNLMVPRNLAQIFPDRLTYDPGLSEALHPQDKGFFYHQFILNQKS